MVSVQARDRHAMRVVAGIPQKMCKLFRDLFAQGMFEQMRLFVHLRFRHFQYGMEEHLNDAVLVCDELCGLASARREPDRCIRALDDETVAHELFEALRDGRFAQAQVAGDFRYSHAVGLFFEAQYGAEVVLAPWADGCAVHIQMFVSTNIIRYRIWCQFQKKWGGRPTRTPPRVLECIWYEHSACLCVAGGDPAAGLASIRVLPLRSSNLDTRDLRNERNCVKINILSSD